MNMQEFIEVNHIRITSEYTDSNPNMVEERYTMNHYRVRLSCKDSDGKRHQMTTYFSMGVGLRGDPEADSVLDCLASDASGVENARDFEDFAYEYGYDSDSRKAERIYKACQKSANQLKRFLGDTAYAELLWDVERL